MCYYHEIVVWHGITERDMTYFNSRVPVPAELALELSRIEATHLKADFGGCKTVQELLEDVTKISV